jgi:hypothetical protein
MEYSYFKTKESLTNSVKSILTSENWNYSKDKFTKTNNTISLNILEYDNEMEIKGGKFNV